MKKHKTFQEVKTYEDLQEFLCNWRSWENPDAYDFGGIMHLLLACMDNLREFAVDGEIQDITNFLDDEQKQFLQKLAKASYLPQDDN